MRSSLTSALDLTGTQHFGQKDGGRERADSFDGAGQLMIAGELLVRADLLGNEFFQACLLGAECSDHALWRGAHIRSDPFQAVLLRLEHQGEFFTTTHQGLEMCLPEWAVAMLQALERKQNRQ